MLRCTRHVGGDVYIQLANESRLTSLQHHAMSSLWCACASVGAARCGVHGVCCAVCGAWASSPCFSAVKRSAMQAVCCVMSQEAEYQLSGTMTQTLHPTMRGAGHPAMIAGGRTVRLRLLPWGGGAVLPAAAGGVAAAAMRWLPPMLITCDATC